MQIFRTALVAILAAGILGATPATGTLSPQKTLARIRAVFRSHRPPAPYVTYTLVRAQQAANGYPDYPNSYTYHLWCRTSDNACLGRKVFREDARGPLEFLQPVFNEDVDPGPPTADLFQKARVRRQAGEPSPTPAPSPPLAVIGSVTALGETEYNVTSMAIEGELLHVSVVPRRDVDRNRLREIWVDKHTYELKKIVATDKLFVLHDKVYPVAFTITMGEHRGRPVVTDIHGVVGGGYDDDGAIVDYHFENIIFPVSLPSWYFNPRDYATYASQSPE
ncbi:MAG TPA: hypothetical protein VIG32_05215 [Candidatus Baltobacteraceae bacterium]|jgi:hypothetical protein